MAYTYNFSDFHCHGPWAVVDAFYGTIWINVPTIELARIIRDAFAYKINPAIVDISTSPDYHPDLVDDSVCLDWQLEIDQDTFVETLPELDDTEHASYAHSDGAKLINRPCALPLGVDRCREIQNQIRSLIMLYRVLHSQNILEESLLDQIKYCYSVGLTLEEIEHRLFDLANNNMDQSQRACLTILSHLGKLYD